MRTQTTAGRLTGRRTMIALLALLLALVAWQETGAAAPPDKQPLYDFQALAHTGVLEPIQGGFSMLDRGAEAVTTRIRTSAEPGHAVTIWYVIFNEPAACLGGACGLGDLFIGGDEANGLNSTQIGAARISLVYGGDGDVVNPGGRLALDGGLAVGEVPTGSAPVVIGRDADGALIPEAASGAVVTGLEDAAGAEIHVVLQHHGPAHDDPELVEQQLTGFRTACNPVPAEQEPPQGSCRDIQFAVHK